MREVADDYANWPHVRAAREMASDYERKVREAHKLRTELDNAKALNNGLKARVDALTKRVGDEIDRNASLTEQRNNLSKLLTFISTGLGGDPNNYNWTPDSVDVDYTGRVKVTVTGFRHRGAPAELGDPDDDALYDDGPRDEEVRRQLDAVIDEINQTFPGFRARVHDRLES